MPSDDLLSLFSLSLSLSQVDLEEESLKKRAAALTTKQKVILYSLRVLMSLVSFGLIIGAFYAIFLATEFSQVNDVKGGRWSICGLKIVCDCFHPLSYKQGKSGLQGIMGLIYEYLPSIVITAGNFVVPLLCDQIALVERYAPSTTVIVALLRFAPVFLWEYLLLAYLGL